MGEGRQEPKAAPVHAGTDPGGPKVPGKAPPLPGRATNGLGSGVSPVAPVAAVGGDDGGIAIPIDTEPPVGLGQSGDTAPPPPELAPPGMDAPLPPPDPTPVDFDALHAALGEGSREAAPPPAAPQPTPHVPHVAPKGGRPAVAESQGRSSATYASSRAQAPPAAHVDADLAAPAVIVAQDDTVPAGAPQMTTPMAPAMAPPMHAQHHSPHMQHAAGPQLTPSSGGMRAAAPHLPTGNTPQAFDPVALGLPPVRPGQPALTMRMPERPRRPRTPTVVVRARGPSTRQKLVVFSVMLILVSMIGLVIVMWRAPQLFGFGPKAQPAATAATTATTTAKPMMSIAPTATTSAPAASASVPIPTTSASALPPASASAAPPAKPGLKPKAR